MKGRGLTPAPFFPNLETYEWLRLMARSTRLRTYEKRTNPYPRNIGTGLAVIDIIQSEVQVNAIPTLSRWGGARNRADRTSDALSLTTARKIIEAAYRAIKMGLPLNRFVTLHLERAGIVDADAAVAIGKLMKLATDWVKSRGGSIAWTWVRENDTGDSSKGSHVHLLLHCPDTLPIGRMWRRWLRKVAGQPYLRKSIKSERIGGTLNAHASNLAAYLQNLDRVLAYVCKGVSPADAQTLGLPRHEAGGNIIGKRAAWSQNIGKQSRVLPLQ